MAEAWDREHVDQDVEMWTGNKGLVMNWVWLMRAEGINGMDFVSA